MESRKKRICTQWRETDLEHLNVKGTLYVLSTYPGVLKKVVENRKCTELPQTGLNQLTVKKYTYTLSTCHRGPNLAPFRPKNKLLFWYKIVENQNKRSKDLGALLDSCNWDDIGNFLQTCIKNSLLQTKSIEIFVNSHRVPHYACINFKSYSTP